MTATDPRQRPIDMDNHYYEPLDCFSRHIEPKYRDVAITAKQKWEGAPDFWTVADIEINFLHVLTEAVPKPGALAAMLAGLEESADVEFREVIDARDYPEFVNREARLATMDAQGIDASLMITSTALYCEFYLRGRPEVLCANYRAFNRWLEEDWGYGTDGRIYGVPLVTLVDLDWAVEELDRLVERGTRFIFIKIGPVNGRSPADPYFDPFWARVQECGVKPVFHAGYEGFSHLYGTHWGEAPDRNLFEYSPMQHYLCFGERPISDTLASLVLHNLFGRFPGIEVLSIENGSTWVAPLLKSMDKAMRMGRHGPQLGGKVADKPSDIFRNHVYVAPFHEEDKLGLVEEIGAERVLFGSDYPHPEGLAVPLDFLQGLESLDEKQLHSIMRGNAARLIGLPS